MADTTPVPNTDIATGIATDVAVIAADATAITNTTNSKPFYLSVTLWGMVISTLPQLLPHLGIKFDDASAQAIAGGIVTIIGAGITIYGRLRASQNLHVVIKK
jgi:hypothetical protein